jgi:hypothetical protein
MHDTFTADELVTCLAHTLQPVLGMFAGTIAVGPLLMAHGSWWAPILLDGRSVLPIRLGTVRTDDDASAASIRVEMRPGADWTATEAHVARAALIEALRAIDHEPGHISRADWLALYEAGTFGPVHDHAG